MDAEFSRRLGSALGRGGIPFGPEWDAMFKMENRIRDWASNNPTASWETMPEEFRAYILLVERTA